MMDLEVAASIGAKLIEASPVIGCSIIFCILFFIGVIYLDIHLNKKNSEERTKNLEAWKSGYADLAEKNNKHLEIVEKSYNDLQKSYNELVNSTSQKENGKRK